MTSAQQKFVIDIYSRCKRIGVAYNNLCPIAVTAQACIESNYGRSTLSKSYHNYFGLKTGKSWKGKVAKFKTKEEYVCGILTTIYAEFRAYDSLEEGIKGYYEFVDTKRYQNLKGVTSPIDYVRLIKEDGYATSYSYVQNVLSVVNSITSLVNLYDSDLVKNIALEVIDNKWGNGEERKDRLTKAGLSYDVIQTRVNEILKG